MARSTPTSSVQRPWRDEAEPRRRVHQLPVERLHPTIRIAHVRHGELHIEPRVILDHELFLITRGTGELRWRDRVTPLKPGTLVLIRPFVRHAITMQGPCEHTAIHFDLCADVPARSNQPQRRAPYEVRLTRNLALPETTRLAADHRMTRTIDRTVEAFGRTDDLGEAEASCLLLQTLLWLLATPDGSPSGAYDKSMRRAVEYVDKHLAEVLTPDDLADAAGMSGSHFRRVFRAWSGRSVMAFVTEARMARARTLLAEPDSTVQAVAEAVGYTDPYHFSRVFSRHDGLPPSEYRRLALAGRAAL